MKPIANHLYFIGRTFGESVLESLTANEDTSGDSEKPIKLVAGRHTTQSPDNAWTVSVTDGSISSGEHGVTMDLYRGEQPISRSDKAPVLTFEAPLETFDARASSTTAQWSEDGKECRWMLETTRGEAILVVSPTENRVFYDHQFIGRVQYVNDPLPCILVFVLLFLGIGIWGYKRGW